MVPTHLASCSPTKTSSDDDAPDTTPTSPPEKTVKAVDPDGDLILHVGAKLVGEDAAASFKVCAAALRRASAVWKNMLFGPWIESKPAEGEWTVDLPEDNPESLGVLLAILHGTFCDVPGAVSLDFLCGILVVADKYDLIHLVRPFVDRWVGAVKSPDLEGRYNGNVPLLGFTGSDHFRRIYAAWELGCDDFVAAEITDFIFNFSCAGTTFYHKLTRVVPGDHFGPPDLVGK